MGKAIDISKLQENGRAMDQPAQQITEALIQPIQDATPILELGAQYGVPGVPNCFTGSSGQTSPPRSTR